MVCGACHGQNGEGTAAGPPLAGSEWVGGPVENLIRIQLRGLHGPIKVKGQEYDFPAGMAALAYQSDEQIAAVLTYVRNSFGNSAAAVTPAAVTALRGEVGKPPLSAADLTQPDPTATPAAPSVPAAGGAAPSPATAGKYDDLGTQSPVGRWVVIGLVALAAVAGAFRFMKKR